MSRVAEGPLAGERAPEGAALRRVVAIRREELGALLHYASHARHTEYAHIWALMYLVGLTPSEVVALRFEHLVEGLLLRVRVPTPRHRKADWAPVPTIEVPVLGSTATVAQAFAFDAPYRDGRPLSPWLFPSPDDPDRHLSSYSVTHRFRAHQVAAGLRADLVPSSLREAGAQDVFEAARERDVVRRWKRLSGSRDILTTHWQDLEGCLDLPPICPLPYRDRVAQPAHGLEL